MWLSISYYNIPIVPVWDRCMRADIFDYASLTCDLHICFFYEGWQF
jgi:hypothetical protein